MTVIRKAGEACAYQKEGSGSLTIIMGIFAPFRCRRFRREAPRPCSCVLLLAPTV